MEHIDLIEQRLQTLIPSLAQPIYQAARYSLLSAGKRLRPLLVLAAAEACQGDIQSAIDPACAIEMIHTYSLIHDDLPCMDDDELRRGRPTLHKVFSEGIALLTGDYLLTYAFEILSKSPSLAAETKLRLIQILAHASGSEGMIGGQAIDIDPMEGMDESSLLRMHKGKTAALLTACLQFGAILGNASDATMFALRSLGEEIGLAYQFLDDLLDATSTPEILGKKTRRDQEKGKNTAVSFYGIEQVQKKLFTFQTSIEHRLNELFPNAPRLTLLIRAITCFARVNMAPLKVAKLR